MHAEPMELRPIGRVESPLTDLDAAPMQADEGAPEATIAVAPEFAAALEGVAPGQRIVVLTWLHLGDRSTLRVHPRSDPSRPMQGVFATRSPDRPNPIGMHEVEVLAVDGTRVRVAELEALNGTPVVDLKPVLSGPR